MRRVIAAVVLSLVLLPFVKAQGIGPERFEAKVILESYNYCPTQDCPEASEILGSLPAAYGSAFAVSPSALVIADAYINNNKNHHKDNCKDCALVNSDYTLLVSFYPKGSQEYLFTNSVPRKDGKLLDAKFIGQDLYVFDIAQLEGVQKNTNLHHARIMVFESLEDRAAFFAGQDVPEVVSYDAPAAALYAKNPATGKSVPFALYNGSEYTGLLLPAAYKLQVEGAKFVNSSFEPVEIVQTANKNYYLKVAAPAQVNFTKKQLAAVEKIKSEISVLK